MAKKLDNKEPLLYELLRVLSKSELRQLKKYVRSPFVTHRPEVVQLANLLIDCCYQQQSFPSKSSLFEAVFGTDKYDDQRLRSMSSDLHRIVQRFAGGLADREDSIAASIRLGTLYRKRNLARHYTRISRSIEQQFQTSEYRNAGHYQNYLQFQIEANRHTTSKQRTSVLNLQEIGDTMDQLYLMQKLRHVCSQISHRAVYQTDYEFGLLPQWIDQLEGSSYLDIPAIALYYYCYRFLTETDSPVHFRKFRQELQCSQEQFPQDELKDLYRAAINFCIRKLNQGDMDFTREGWELYQAGLADGVFLENQQLSRFTFDNIVGFGLRLEEFEPVSQFIQGYQTLLAEEFREGSVFFNLARLEYGRQNYDQALRYLQQAYPKDLVNQLILKTIQLKIYYETGELDLLDSHLESFRHFIRRREVSDYHRTNFSKVISFTRKLLSLPLAKNRQHQELIKAIKQEPILSERAWLLSKLNP